MLAVKLPPQWQLNLVIAKTIASPRLVSELAHASPTVKYELLERNVAENTHDPKQFCSSRVFQKAQSNGRAVAEPQEEAIVSEEIVPHHQPPPQVVKTEKVAEVICRPSDMTTHGQRPEHLVRWNGVPRLCLYKLLHMAPVACQSHHYFVGCLSRRAAQKSPFFSRCPLQWCNQASYQCWVTVFSLHMQQNPGGWLLAWDNLSSYTTLWILQNNTNGMSKGLWSQDVFGYTLRGGNIANRKDILQI